MKRLAFLIIIGIFYTLPTQATSLDEIYRDIIKSDNEGYLPLFVKNRNIPDVLVDDSISEIPTVPNTTEPKVVPYEIPLVDKYKLEAEAKAALQRKWDNTIKAVQENRVTPVELEEILKHVTDNNPKAVEIYAWMNANGVGVKQDLLKSFELYQQAIFLQVPNATKNATIVYRSMNPEQKKEVKAYTLPEEDEEELLAETDIPVADDSDTNSSEINPF